MVLINEVEDYISTFIANQFPAVYRDDGPLMVLFVKAYYEWLETNNQSSNLSRDLIQYVDVDQSVSSFLDHFKKTYLFSIPESDNIDFKFLIKHVLDLYRSKGSKRSLELFFKLVYNKNVDVYIPNEHIFKASDAIYFTPRYLETYADDATLKGLLGSYVHGDRSGATAYVSSIVGTEVHGRIIHILYLEDLKGEFIANELVEDQTNTYQARLSGSLSGINITVGGSGYSVGQDITVKTQANTSTEGVIRVTSTANGTGVPLISVFEGGSGYSSNNSLSNVIVSDVILEVSSISNTFTSAKFDDSNTAYSQNTRPANTFDLFETVTIPRSTLTFTPTSGFTSTINNQTYVIGANSTLGHVANGLIAGFTNTEMTIYRKSGDWTSAVKLLIAGNTAANAVVNTYVDNTITGTYVGIKTLPSGSIVLGLTDNSATIPAESQSFLKGNSSNTVATIFANRSGSNTVMSINAVGNVASSNVYTNYLAGNNSGNVPFMNIVIDGSNSNVASNGYGFTKDTSANVNSILDRALTYESSLVGEVRSLTITSTGSGYLADPIVLVQNKFLDHKQRGLKEVKFTQRAGAEFTVGDIIRQTNPLDMRILTFNTGTTDNFQVGEGIIHVVNSTANTVGQVDSIPDSYTLVIRFAKTFDSDYNIIGVGQDAAFNVQIGADITGRVTGEAVSGIDVDEIITLNAVSTSKVLQTYPSNNSIVVKEMSIEENEVLYVSNTYRMATNNNSKSAEIIGVVDFSPNTYNFTTIAGTNANVFANVAIGTGVINTVSIVDSGLKFKTGEELIFKINGTTIAVNGTAVSNGTGVSPGTWRSESGLIGSDSFIHDNDFYQTYSYQVLSELELNRYEKVLKEVIHTAGYKLFGKVQIDTYDNTSVSITESSVSQA